MSLDLHLKNVQLEEEARFDSARLFALITALSYALCTECGDPLGDDGTKIECNGEKTYHTDCRPDEQQS